MAGGIVDECTKGRTWSLVNDRIISEINVVTFKMAKSEIFKV